MGAPSTEVLNVPGVAALGNSGATKLIPLWKGGTPGQLFVNNDTVSPNFGDMVMFTGPFGDTLNFNLPVAGAADVGKKIGFYDATFASKSQGTLLFVPQTGQKVAGHTASATRKLSGTSNLSAWFALKWDGNDTWLLVDVGAVLVSPSDAFIAP